MQISHFHRRENFITLYWFRNNSLTSIPSFSLHINLSLFKVLSSFFNWLLWSVLYHRLLKDCLSYIQLCHSCYKTSTYVLCIFYIIWVFRNDSYISLMLTIWIAFFNAKYLWYTFMDLHHFLEMTSIYIDFFLLFQIQLCINIIGYNGFE